MTLARAKITRNRFRELSKQGREAAARRNRELAEVAEDIAKQLVPVASGALKKTIRVEPNARTGSASVVAGSDEVDYAAAVEYGTRHSPAQPFLGPAAESAAKRSRNVRTRMYRG